jgi:sRNA-binding regulator protein Hfq
MNNTGNTDERTKHNRNRLAQGHEIPLSSMAKRQKVARIVCMDGEIVEAVLHGFDKWTISVLDSETDVPITYFKHALKSFTSAEG